MYRGRWKHGTGKRGTMKFTGVENAGLDNKGPNHKGGKCGSGKRGTKLQGWKTRDWKTWDQIAGVENAGLENAGTSLVWVARRNIMTVLRWCVRVMWKRVVSRPTKPQWVRDALLILVKFVMSFNIFSEFACSLSVYAWFDWHVVDGIYIVVCEDFDTLYVKQMFAAFECNTAYIALC